MDVDRPRHRGLTTMRALFMCSLNLKLTRKHWADGNFGKANTNSFPDQQSLYCDEQHTRALYTKCGPHVGLLLFHGVLF